MQILVDFRGFRIVCMPMLPVKGNRSMVYGSDAGKLPILNGRRVTESQATALLAKEPCNLTLLFLFGCVVFG